MNREKYKFLLSLPLGIIIFSFFFSFSSIWIGIKDYNLMAAWFGNILVFSYYGLFHMILMWVVFILIYKLFFAKVNLIIYWVIGLGFCYFSILFPLKLFSEIKYLKMALSCGVSGLTFALLLRLLK